MRIIDSKEIEDKVYKICLEANFNLEDDLYKKISDMSLQEESDIGKSVLRELIQNADIAKKEKKPICQDTGMGIFFVEIGNNVFIEGDIKLAIEEGMKKAYRDGFLRKSIVNDPINRVNTNDNTPPIIHFDYKPGDKLKIQFSPKGFGSENMSRIKMLAPSEGIEGIKKFIIETVEIAGGNPCPPIIVGVGIGGDFEYSAIMAKQALLRQIGQRNKDNYYKNLELELLDKINRLGIGPQGYGGTQTAIEVFIEKYPTHIAGLPVAVNISCHATRHKEVII